MTDINNNTGVRCFQFLDQVYNASLEEGDLSRVSERIEQFRRWITEESAFFYEAYDIKNPEDFGISRRSGRSVLLSVPTAVEIKNVTDGKTTIADFFSKELELKEMVAYVSSVVSEENFDVYSHAFGRIPIALICIDFYKIFPDPTEIPLSLLNLVNNISALQAYLFNQDNSRKAVVIRPSFLKAFNEVHYYRLADMYIQRIVRGLIAEGQIYRTDQLRKEAYAVGKSFPPAQRQLWIHSVDTVLFSMIKLHDIPKLTLRKQDREECHIVDSRAVDYFLQRLHKDLMSRTDEISRVWRLYESVEFDLSNSLFALRLGLYSLHFTIGKFPEIGIQLRMEDGLDIDLTVDVQKTTSPEVSVPRFASSFGISKELSMDIYVIVYTCLVDLLNKVMLDNAKPPNRKGSLKFDPVVWASDRVDTAFIHQYLQIHTVEAGDQIIHFVNPVTGEVSSVIKCSVVVEDKVFYRRPMNRVLGLPFEARAVLEGSDVRVYLMPGTNSEIRELLDYYYEMPRFLQLELLIFPQGKETE